MKQGDKIEVWHDGLPERYERIFLYKKESQYACVYKEDTRLYNNCSDHHVKYWDNAKEIPKPKIEQEVKACDFWRDTDEERWAFYEVDGVNKEPYFGKDLGIRYGHEPDFRGFILRDDLGNIIINSHVNLWVYKNIFDNCAFGKEAVKCELLGVAVEVTDE